MRSVPRDGRERDDAAGSPSLHPRQNTLESQKGGGEVAIHRGSPALFAGLFERTGWREAAARIGNKNIDRSQLALDLGANISESFSISAPCTATFAPRSANNLAMASFLCSSVISVPLW